MKAQSNDRLGTLGRLQSVRLPTISEINRSREEPVI